MGADIFRLFCNGSDFTAEIEVSGARTLSRIPDLVFMEENACLPDGIRIDEVGTASSVLVFSLLNSAYFLAYLWIYLGIFHFWRL